MRLQEVLRRERRWRSVGRICAVTAVAVLGAVIGLLLAGTRSDHVGPLVIRSQVLPSLTGDSFIDVPPLGSIRLDSHDGPLALHAQVDGIDVDATKGVLTGASLGSRDEIVSQVRSLLIGAYVQALAAACVGALVLVLAVWRRRATALIAGLCTIGLVIASAAVAALTWDEAALAEPRYSGLLVYAPRVVGSADDVINDFEKYGDQLARLVSNVSRLASTLTSLPNFEPDPDTVRVLFVSDIHLNPNVWPIMRTIADQYEVNVVLDAGDIADQGSSAEVPLLDPIGSLGIPYVYVRGNHDSGIIEDAVAKNSNAVALNGKVVEVAGLRILGDGDPRFTPDKDALTSSDQVVQLGEQLADVAAEESEPIDIVLVHDPLAAESLADSTPLILAGHVHERGEDQLDDDSLLLTQGSTGGAGLRALESEDPTPLTFTVLYFDRATGQMQARDEITLGGLGTTTAEVSRILTDDTAGRTP